MTTVEILTEARKLVEKGWTQGNFAADPDGRLADIYGSVNPPARFCAEGAILRVCGGAQQEYVKARYAVCDAVNRVRLTKWNDAPGRTQAEVLAAFDKAIELAKSEAPQAPSHSQKGGGK